LSRVMSQKLVFVGAKRSKADLTLLRDLIGAGKITPVIDRQYNLSEAAAAMAHLGAGHARGKVIITVGG